MKRMNRDQIKLLAIFLMTLNHIAWILLPEGTLAGEIMKDLGYFTAITMCYFLVESSRYTRSENRYAKRLLVFAAISQLPYCLAFSEGVILEPVQANMMFSLFLCELCVLAMEHIPDQRKRRFCIAACFLVSMWSDWAGFAVMFTVFFYKAANDRQALKRAFAISTAMFWGLEFLNRITSGTGIVSTVIGATGACAGPALASVVILNLYNGKRAGHGREVLKWFFYIYYPAHLLVLGTIRVGILRGFL